MLAKNRLKPCPFCGGEADVVIGGEHKKKYKVYCTKCQVRQYWHSTRKKAVDAWNLRCVDGIYEEMENRKKNEIKFCRKLEHLFCPNILDTHNICRAANSVSHKCDSCWDDAIARFIKKLGESTEE